MSKPRYRFPVKDDDGVYGFEWGPMSVVRLGHVEGRGYFLAVQTEHDEIELFVSEKGKRIRIGKWPG